MITNIQLVDYAKSMLGHPYWYGCFGQISTKALYSAKKKQYPDQYQWACKDNQEGVSPKKQLGTEVTDCIGLIKGAIWKKGKLTNKTQYNPSQDMSANDTLAYCKKKKMKHGAISSLPEVKGVLVFLPGHVGVYIGGGKVIEAKGHKWGVVETKVEGRGWKEWAYCPWITYVEEKKTETKPTTTKSATTTKPATSKYYQKYTGSSPEVDKVLKAIGVPEKYRGSWKKRKPLAKANGISLYVGSAQQNNKLKDLANQGKLKKV